MILFSCFVSRSRNDYSPPKLSCQSKEAKMEITYDLLLKDNFMGLPQVVVRKFIKEKFV